MCRCVTEANDRGSVSESLFGVTRKPSIDGDDRHDPSGERRARTRRRPRARPRPRPRSRGVRSRPPRAFRPLQSARADAPSRAASSARPPRDETFFFSHLVNISRTRGLCLASILPQASPDAWRACVDRYPSTSYPEVRFWCLQTLTDAFKTSGVLQMLSDDDASFLQRTLLSWVAEAVQRADPPVPPFVKNKLAQVVALVAKTQFPQRWPRFTHDFLDLLTGGEPTTSAFGGGCVLPRDGRRG